MNEQKRQFITSLLILLMALGVFTETRAFFIAAIIPATYLLLQQNSKIPETSSVEFRREIGDSYPSPGEEVEVKLKIKNKDEKTIRDLRVVDEPPEGVNVVSGSEKCAVSLKPKSETEINYKVIAGRGRHKFEGFSCVVRSGTRLNSLNQVVEGDENISCMPGLQSVSLSNSLGNENSGNGVEFHSLREYNSSDSLSRVEWRQFAKTGKLATKNFKQDIESSTVLVLDARKVSSKKAKPGHPSTEELSTYAAERIFSAISKTNESIGLAVIGVDNSEFEINFDHPNIAYIEPIKNPNSNGEISRVIRDIETADKNDSKDIGANLLDNISTNSKVVLFTPLLDDKLVSSIQLLKSRKISCTVISPDITYDKNPCAVLESIQRDMRVKKLSKELNVVDWDVTKRLDSYLSRGKNDGFKTNE